VVADWSSRINSGSVAVVAIASRQMSAWGFSEDSHQSSTSSNRDRPRFDDCHHLNTLPCFYTEVDTRFLSLLVPCLFCIGASRLHTSRTREDISCYRNLRICNAEKETHHFDFNSRGDGQSAICCISELRFSTKRCLSHLRTTRVSMYITTHIHICFV
jgi:hypothetical protein